jgi:hypothetical protein
MERSAFTIPEIAQKLGRSCVWVRRCVRSGLLEARQISPEGGPNAKWLITPSALRRFILKTKVIS